MVHEPACPFEAAVAAPVAPGPSTRYQVATTSSHGATVTRRPTACSATVGSHLTAPILTDEARTCRYPSPSPRSSPSAGPDRPGRLTRMTGWGDFEAQAPALAAFGADRLAAAAAYLATMRRNGSPRVHPVRADRRGRATVRLHGAELAQGARPPRAPLVCLAQRRARHLWNRWGVLRQGRRHPAGRSRPSIGRQCSVHVSHRGSLGPVRVGNRRGTLQRVRRRRAAGPRRAGRHPGHERVVARATITSGSAVCAPRRTRRPVQPVRLSARSK